MAQMHGGEIGRSGQEQRGTGQAPEPGWWEESGWGDDGR